MKRNYPPAMVAACEAALDARMFYNNDFDTFVLEHMGGPDCEAVLLREVECSQHREVVEIEKAVLAAPRGHYVLIRKRYDDQERWVPIMSTGSGISSICHDTYAERPSADELLRALLSQDIYQCRHAVARQRELDADVAASRHPAVRLGAEIRNFSPPGEVRTFSTATVTGIDSASGQVALMMTQRGSRKRWTMRVGARRVIDALGTALADVDSFSLS